MARIPHLKSLAALCTLQLLGGCVAAAAVVPLLAGGTVVGSRVLKDDSPDKVAAAPIPRPPFDRPASTQAITAEPVIEPVIELTVPPTAQPGLRPAAANAELTPPPSTSIPATTLAAANPPVPQPAVAQVSAAETPATQMPAAVLSTSPPAVRRELTPTPPAEAAPPSGGISPPIELTLPDGRKIALSADSTGGTSAAPAARADFPAAFSTVDARAYDGLLSYAMEQSQPAKIGDRRKSVLLAAPGALKPETSQCGVSQPAILIDLDPGETLLDISAEFAPNAPLAAALAVLRTRNVSVHWLSGNSATEAGALRQRLAESGLDPDGRDELVLMRYPDDRKQVRRRAVGATHCLIAIAGEERRDFDELYAYLKSRDSALALESLVGNGWFLVPPALANQDQ